MGLKVLDIQRRGQQIGRLRIGQQVANTRGNGTHPVRLDTFRFTTGSRYVAESVAALYGGQVVPWERGQFEVITTQADLWVTIPPRDQIVSQSYEMWNKGGCIRRCDSQHEQLSNGPCVCPHAEDTTNADEVATAALKRAELAKLNPPQACKLITRISVMLPDLPGLGVWRLDTHSYYAAVEIGDQAELMERAREHGVFLRGLLRIDHRERVAGGQTTKFPVPVLEILDTFRDLVSGAIEGRDIAAQLPPSPGDSRLAITSGRGPQAAAKPTQAGPAAPDDDDTSAEAAQRIADQAAAATSKDAVKALAVKAEQLGVAEDLVCTDQANEVYEQLREYLRAEYRKHAAAERRVKPGVPPTPDDDPDDPGPVDPGQGPMGAALHGAASRGQQAGLDWPEA